MIDAVLILAAIVVALLAGLAFGPLLDVGQVAAGRWWPFVVAAALAAGVVASFRTVKWTGVWVFGWTLLGGALCVLILCGIAAQSWPRFTYYAAEPPPAGARETLALRTGLDLFWGSSRTLSALDTMFKVDRLDVLSRGSLQFKQRLLLAQPQLLAPQELVALDEWIREGGRAVILADPLLIWPSDLPIGDRRRPPMTSLLDPLITHWGLTLKPATSKTVQRRFVDGDRLLLAEGASTFTASRNPFARCQQIDDGFMVTCRVGMGKVRLIADADLLDDRLWRPVEGGLLASDTMALLDRWLRRPMSPASAWANATIWVRDRSSVISGIRWALLAAVIWAVVGSYAWSRGRGLTVRARADASKDETHGPQRT